MQSNKPLAFILFAVLTFLLMNTATAQKGQRYRTANNLMNQQKYEQAYQILSDLIQDHPDVQALYDRAIQCLVNLKRYEEAIELSTKRIKKGHSKRETSIRLGELYHLNGDTTRAFQTWQQVLDQHSDQLQTYLQVARSMKERNEYTRSIDIYKQAQRRFRNDQLFANELAFTYQMAGNYEKAIQQYLLLIKDNPQRTEFVKRSLMRFKDDYLFDVAVVEFNRFLNDMSIDHKAYRPLRQLYQWLLLEMNLYERAFGEARSFEQETQEATLALFNIGNRLLSAQKFDLAVKAFQYYQNSSNAALRLKSLEKLGDVYLQWADYQSDYNLVYTSKRDSLYKKANRIYTQLLDEKPDYQQVGRVLMKQAELALDYLKNVEKAESHFTVMQQNGQIGKARTEYIEGRIKLFHNEFDRARIAFTNSYKASEQDALTEKSRYYLALTNFYSGDFEYARLQIKALERQSTSYYANDALQLRMWIQDGMQKDSASAELRGFANAIHLLKHDKVEKALEVMSPWLHSKEGSPLVDHAMLALAQHSRTDVVPVTYTLLNRFLSSSSSSPLRERLLWEKARMAEQIVRDQLKNEFENGVRSSIIQRYKESIEFVDPPTTLQEVQNLYEKILIDFPQGFYATHARQRIQQLENKQT